VKPNITTIMQEKKPLQKSHCKHVTKHRKNCNVQTCLMLCVFFCFVFFAMHKTVRPADTDEVADLAQLPKSCGSLH